MQAGAEIIIETDDDNFPRKSFWAPRNRMVNARSLRDVGWINVYRYFSDALIWPRGLPLDAVNVEPPRFKTLPIDILDCPIQQGLADDNPDVDAIYRLVLPLPQTFRSDRRIGLREGSWCVFNSQNTAWWPDAFPLLYLPAFCSFRMTDIWRSLIAQRLAWPNKWTVLFHEPTVYQERNPHNLMRDFADEVPGYLHNRAIAEALDAMTLRAGPTALIDNLRAAYTVVTKRGFVGNEEMELLEAWLEDLADMRVASPTMSATSSQIALTRK